MYSLESPCLEEAILMSTHNIPFHDKISTNICFLSYWKNIVGTQKRVRISDGKRVISVRVIEVLLYMDFKINVPVLVYTINAVMKK